ncbi:MAG: TonB-dependent receptor [Bacteroidales bacterium]|nr:TonB-dependent receptor [Bacteroidales bacterium]
MKKQLFLAIFLPLLFIAALPAFADNEGSSAVIKGRVVDTNGEVLPGASIIVEGANQGTVSDVDGYYTLSKVDPGKRALVVSYVGYETQRVSVNLTQGQTSVVNITMQSGVELQEVQVVGALSGQRKAYNMQQNSLGLANVVSADQIGKFPDANIGDALKRITGINVQYDQGEARYGQVRGTSPDLSSVTINGNRVPSAEGDVRYAQLDIIPSDMIQTIEVNKVVTADMDGDAIGGAVNLVTKNSPYRRVFNATLGSGLSFITNKAQINAGLTYGDRFFKNKFGILLSASFANAPAGSDNTEFGYVVNDNNEVVLDDAQIRQYYVTRRRQSYSISFDYDINANNRLYLKGIYNRRDDWENRYRITYKDISKGEGKMQARIQTKGSTPENKNMRLELQQTLDFTLGGEHQIKALKMDWNANYARATEARPEERYFDLVLKKQTFEFFDVFDEQPYTTFVADPTDSQQSGWGIKEITNQNRMIIENDLKFRLNFELPLAKGLYGSMLKFGAKYTRKTKSRVTDLYDYTAWYEDNYGTEYTNHYVTQVRDGFIPGSKYQKGNFVSREYLGSFDFDPANGEYDLQTASSNFNALEHITAGYVRYDQKLGSRMKLVAGLRLEATNLKYSGYVYDVAADGTETLTPTGDTKNNYINLLPSLLYKWDINKQWNLRASFTKTISRPKYSYLIPSVSIDSKSNSRTQVTLGNPDLKPAISYNLDLATEYYFKKLGVVSGGIFYKRINNFIVNEVTLGSYKTFADCEITTPVNGFDGNLFGVELGVSTDFGFITPALNCIGFDGNYTMTATSVASCSVGDKNEQVMPGSPKNMLNLSLYFTKWGFNARFSFNYTSAFQDDEAYQADSRLRRYYDATKYMDVNLGYTFGRDFKTTIYAEATNLLNQPLRYYIGGNPKTTTQVEYYMPRINFGVKIAL